MIIIDRIQKANANRKYRDDLISRVSAMRDSGMSNVAIAKALGTSESTIRTIIKRFL